MASNPGIAVMAITSIATSLLYTYLVPYSGRRHEVVEIIESGRYSKR